MQKIPVFLFILPFLCGLPLIHANDPKISLAHDWVFVSDFKPDELANLTSQEEHQLLLKSLYKQKSDVVELIVLWELLGKAGGIELCRIAYDDSTNRENTAIVRAAFECVAKLQFQEQTAHLIEKLPLPDYLEETNDLVKGFSKLCSKINQRLENITFYKERTDHHRKTDLWQPKKTFLYGIPKNEEEFRKNLTDFVNNPEMKKISILVAFVWYYRAAEKEWPGKRVLMHLTQEPGKLEIVQNIFVESVLELVPDIEDISPDRIQFNKELGRNLNNVAIAFNKKLKEKIYANADLMKFVTKWKSPETTNGIPELSNKE